jgi:outer membrane protein assembly factor BamB
MRSAFVLICSFFGLPTLASAETVARCYASSGISYFAEGGAVSGDSAGFQDDSISKGQIILNFDSAEQYLDVIHLDATGNVRSARAEGATVVLHFVDDDNVSIGVSYGGQTVETYLFRRNEGEVIWSQTKISPILSKVAVLRAACDF